MASNPDLRQRNLAALRRVAPPLADALADYGPRYALVAAGDDWRLTGAAGERFEKPVGAHFADLMAGFRDGPHRIASHRPQEGEADYYSNRLLGRLLNRAAEEGIAFADTHRTERSFFLIVFGVGLGGHLGALAEITGCRHLILIEPGLECLHHSLDVFDWEAFLSPLEAEGRRVHLLVEPTPAEIAHRLFMLMRSINPAAIDGATFFLDRTNETLTQAFNSFLASEAVNVLNAIGCYNDERLMVRNTLQNLARDGTRLYATAGREPMPLPAFVVAAGPSLDATLDAIRENRDRAVVISCGSALRPLLETGTPPDFHVEMENIAVEVMIQEVAGRHDLSRICLVGSTTLEPIAARHFGNMVAYFKLGATPYYAFCRSDDSALPFTEPGVANAGLSFALGLGCPEIYLFGVDLAVRDPKRHHAQATFHYQQSSLPDDYLGAHTIPADGNDGGQVLTSPFFLSCRSALQLAIRHLGDGRKVFNLGGGIRIEGARPLRPDALRLAPGEGGKETRVRAAVDAMAAPAPDGAEPASALEGLRREVAALLDECRRVVAGSPDLADKAYLGPLAESLRAAQFIHPAEGGGLDVAAALMVRGTVLNMLFFVEYFANRVSGDDQTRRIKALVREELQAVLGELAEAIGEEIPKLADAPADAPADAGGGSRYTEAIPEAWQTWGNVPRNAPCPCGSGKRFKHCHGLLTSGKASAEYHSRRWD